MIEVAAILKKIAKLSGLLAKRDTLQGFAVEAASRGVVWMVGVVDVGMLLEAAPAETPKFDRSF